MIESLTQEQTDSMPSFVTKWKAIGLSTERVDQEKAKQAVELLYRTKGLPMPTQYIFTDGPKSGLKEAKKYGGDLNNVIYGSQDATYLSFYDFFHEHFGIAKEIVGLLEVAKTCGWVWVFEDLVVITDRPTKIKFDDRELLHCENGPAIEYNDGTKIYCWHGQKIPSDWIEKGVDAKTALTWPQVEQRRAVCEILGWVKILDELCGVVIDQDIDPEIGTLIEVDIPEIGKEKFIRVACGTKREFALPVPPEMKTALGAQAWMVGLEESDFDLPEFRT